MTSKHKSPSPPPVSQPTATTAGEDGEAKEEVAQETRIIPQLPQKSHGPDIEKETHRFRELLLFGRKKVCSMISSVL